MHEVRPDWLLAVTAAAWLLCLAGCMSPGGGYQVASCGGRAYDSVMFNSDQYNARDRDRVASAFAAASGAEVTDDILQRVIDVLGSEGDARRIADEFSACIAT